MSPTKSSEPSQATAQSIWRFAVRTRPDLKDAAARALEGDIRDLGIDQVKEVRIAQIYYCLGGLSSAAAQQLADGLLADSITQVVEVSELALDSPAKAAPAASEEARVSEITVEAAYRPGVQDPVEASLKKGAQDLGLTGLEKVHTATETTLVGSLSREDLKKISEKLLINSTIQQEVSLKDLAGLLSPAEAEVVPIETVHLLRASDTVLQRVSLDHQLSLNLEEMRGIQAFYRKEDREPRLIELETIAQTWSEHCKHKTFSGPITYTEEINGQPQKRIINNLLKSTIMKVTEELDKPWCVSVFKDNAGIITFDDQTDVCFKVETHNHPSALEPFGGASTGLGGVIRDILGTGLGAKPIASTDVFCFAPPSLSQEHLPPGVLHPRRLMKGVVAGVRDYGNRMGIPTVNGAVLFDERFVGNPLVYCGNIGLLPKGKSEKKVTPGLKIVVAGGRTGRDGIHGATFSSISLEEASEVVSAAAVQIGDPITEKRLTDALLEARDQGLYASVTDCGAGGLSSAVGEMGADCGARVDLEKVPLKYAGLTPTEIWISESQERMVFAVAPDKIDTLLELFDVRGTEATVIGEFTDTLDLELNFRGKEVGRLQMAFLHKGVPQVARAARWIPSAERDPEIPEPNELTSTLLNLAKSWDICSKEWIIRQYDHEVQGGSVVKPLVGPYPGGPSDAAVIRPRLNSDRGLVVANGINFRYGDIDPYWMAAGVVDEALRQIVAVGGSLDQIALLDNFCWGDVTRPQVLGSLVRAALGCSDAARAFGTPFISGKDSLHNEYRVGERVIQIPGTLLISSIGVMLDVRRAVTMDAKSSGNLLYMVGVTRQEMGGSAYYALNGFTGATVPHVNFEQAPKVMQAMAQAISKGFAVSVHDCSEGGLGIAAAEMAFAGQLGLTLRLADVPVDKSILRNDLILFSESPTRFLVEVVPEKAQDFEVAMRDMPMAQIGSFEKEAVFTVVGLHGESVIQTQIQAIQAAWRQPFQDW